LGRAWLLQELKQEEKGLLVLDVEKGDSLKSFPQDRKTSSKGDSSDMLGLEGIAPAVPFLFQVKALSSISMTGTVQRKRRGRRGGSSEEFGHQDAEIRVSGRRGTGGRAQRNLWKFMHGREASCP
jgi:hypothetical protein